MPNFDLCIMCYTNFNQKRKDETTKREKKETNFYKEHASEKKKEKII